MTPQIEIPESFEVAIYGVFEGPAGYASVVPLARFEHEWLLRFKSSIVDRGLRCSEARSGAHRTSFGPLPRWDDVDVSDLQSGEGRMGDPPTLTLFCGLPGSGKTTLARRLETDGKGIRLCTDVWQAELGVDHGDTDFHSRLQPLLYRHGLTLMRHGVDVILEDGLWMTEERTEKFRYAHACGSRIELHIFDVSYDALWNRLRNRNQDAAAGAYAMTQDELRRAWDLFQRPSLKELASVDSYEFHVGGC
ncbi:MAG: ATP-binding protein [Cryobacterium sp.]|uniref:AAA family ATPase n=1 Tax=unclassified Cryobacterium TaxID=2649013 RepID=UPI0018CB6422|nr:MULTISPECIES: ATP-binding protein [unclassified Cryobacterium]MCY7404165.1 ATP-binding protein [Cryobacterium sp.]